VKQVSGKELVKLVEKKGWALSRINGSHHIFVMAGRRERIVIPVHGNKPLKIGLLRSLMKIAGLEEGDL
jgi:predicted RNA binding protein YcfA (HicA-like mRNA interferase family)